MRDFRIKTKVLGVVGTNCYLVYHEGTKQGVVVDPADDSTTIISMCNQLGVTPIAVLLTHGHSDHILAADDIRNQFCCNIYASVDEDALLQDPACNLSGKWGVEMGLKADCLVRDGEVLSLAGFSWKVITTPGHTAGSTCYYLSEEEVLISGDTLFAESLGRTDLPTSNSRAIITSIVDKLFILPEETMVYPGHGDPTTIGHEKQYNPVAVYGRP